MRRARIAWAIIIIVAGVSIAAGALLARHDEPRTDVQAETTPTPEPSSTVLGKQFANGTVPTIRPPVKKKGAAPEPAHVFDIKGSASGLFPGASIPLRLTIANPNLSPISVTKVVAFSISSDRAGCPSTVLSVNFAGPLRVREQDSVTDVRRLRLVLNRSAGDACQGATFLMRLRGTAVQTS